MAFHLHFTRKRLDVQVGQSTLVYYYPLRVNILLSAKSRRQLLNLSTIVSCGSLNLKNYNKAIRRPWEEAFLMVEPNQEVPGEVFWQAE